MADELLFDQAIETPSPDTAMFRVFKLWQLEEALRLRSLWLNPPSAWDDPFEAFLEKTVMEATSTPLPLARAYAQCWSATGESDTLLRAYSYVAKDRTTGRNLYPGA
jgi:hypothetical protein